jgi:hypothetical protein
VCDYSFDGLLIKISPICFYFNKTYIVELLGQSLFKKSVIRGNDCSFYSESSRYLTTRISISMKLQTEVLWYRLELIFRSFLDTNYKTWTLWTTRFNLEGKSDHPFLYWYLSRNLYTWCQYQGKNPVSCAWPVVRGQRSIVRSPPLILIRCDINCLTENMKKSWRC